MTYLVVLEEGALITLQSRYRAVAVLVATFFIRLENL